MFIVSSRVSWVIMVAPGSEKVVGTSTLTLVDRPAVGMEQDEMLLRLG